MHPISTPEMRETMEAIYFHPAISIIMPFEPKMNSKKEIAHSLKLAADKIEQELMNNYTDEMAMLMMQKLEVIISNLNCSTHKKSIAIYLNPVFEKVLYLDIPVKEKIIVDGSFEIRNLVYSKKQTPKYLLLVLGSEESNMYLGDSKDFVKIIADAPARIPGGLNEPPEQGSHFSDISEENELIANKYLYHIDNTLGIVLNGDHLPLFILGPEKIVNHFKAITRHSGAVIEYVFSNYKGATDQQLKKILEPCVADWKKILQKYLLNRMKEAAGEKKLAVGMREVWREAMKGNGYLLIVEKNFVPGEGYESIDDIIDRAVKPYSRFSYIKNAVDDVIEKVLEGGGDVEFVDENVITEYGHIAIVQYY